MSLRSLAIRPRWSHPGVPAPSLVFVIVALGACAASKSASHPSPEKAADVTMVRHVDVVTAALAGARCQGNRTCACRVPGDDAETQPPAEGLKRLEIRLSADAGEATLTSPTLGKFQAAGPQESCFYIDVVAGSTNDWTFTASTTQAALGVSPRFKLTEYGPKGPYWYDVLTVECIGSGGRCDRPGAEQWMRFASGRRKRGRLDPCGSSVVKGLRWTTSGGQAERDGGLFRDFTVDFALEVKTFATQFAPGSTECVPKDLPAGGAGPGGAP